MELSSGSLNKPLDMAQISTELFLECFQSALVTILQKVWDSRLIAIMEKLHNFKILP